MFHHLCGVVLAVVAAAAADMPLPRHDPPGQLFRRAPMSQASRSIVVNLATNLHLAFDADLCRLHTIWRGGPINLWGPPYSHTKSPSICDFQGEVVFSMPPLPPSPNASPRFLAHAASEAFSVEYEIGVAKVRETFSGTSIDENWRVIREVAASSDAPVQLLAFAGFSAEAAVEGRDATVTADGKLLRFRLDGDASWIARKEQVDYWEERITDSGTEKGNPRTRRQGEETRLFAEFRGRAKIVFGSTLQIPAGSYKPEPALRSFPSAAPVRRSSGDESYKIEHFALPPQAELIVTGMDALPNGDLVLCTWLGEVYKAKGATGLVQQATYQRIARGLIEPLGVKVHAGSIYVAQKGELTRLVDTDGDQEIDRFDCVSSAWGFSGNYHSYTFGPVIAPGDRIFMFITGQRGRADLLYQGFALEVEPKTGDVTPVCDGLRVPHGFGLFRGDVFITDNQGNWIGACKLNHIEQGKFYGFPSSKPSPRAIRTADEVAPPALWFPRSLSPSTSGFAEIEDDRFGPFRGQMIVGDFQNAVLMRACLEQIDGAWQGAVFPFAKGFLSGVNRLVMNSDGRIYVGGGKRTWSTAAPSEFSLERVSFTGETPFEIKDVRAVSDGFVLTFTKPADVETLRDGESYVVKQFNYRYDKDYGSPELDHAGKPGATTLEIEEAVANDDGLSVRLKIAGLKTGFVTSVQSAVLGAEEEELRHDTFYYTLNRIPSQ